MYKVIDRKQTCTSFKNANEIFGLFFKNKQNFSLVFLKNVFTIAGKFRQC